MDEYFNIWYNISKQKVALSLRNVHAEQGGLFGKEMLMRRKLAAAVLAVMCVSAGTAFAEGAIPDHSGTSMSGIKIGTEALNNTVKSYSRLFKASGDRYGVDPNLLAAICQQESSGRNLSYRSDGTEYPAWGIMQIEKSNEKSFAKFGLDTTGTAWTLADRLNEEKSVAYAAHLISKSLIKYDCDYMKMLQAYNFGETVLDRIIAAKDGEWLSERANAKNYVNNWPYDTYGDAEYIEHVLRYYHEDIEYIGAKVRINGELIDFDDQFPIIEEGRTLIPVRAVAQAFDAKVTWNGDYYRAEIEKDGMQIILPINSEVAYIDGEEHTLDVPAQLINDRTMVPLRFVAEMLGIDVEWDQNTRTVLIEE